MKIKLKVAGSSARGVFKPGDVVDWPEYDARPFVAAGNAEVVEAIKITTAARGKMAKPHG